MLGSQYILDLANCEDLCLGKPYIKGLQHILITSRYRISRGIESMNMAFEARVTLASSGKNFMQSP